LEQGAAVVRADPPTADHKGKTLITPPGAKQYVVG
jgi:hypothetical protein